MSLFIHLEFSFPNPSMLIQITHKDKFIVVFSWSLRYFIWLVAFEFRNQRSLRNVCVIVPQIK